MKTEFTTDKWDLMAKYFAQECSEIEKADLMSWVNDNIENEILFFETQKNWEILNLKNNMKEVNIDNAWEKLKNRIEKDNEQVIDTDKIKVFHLSSYMKYAALGLVLIGIGFVSSRVYKNISNKNNFIEYVADNKTNNIVILMDGTKVVLYQNSKLLYPKNFALNERKVKLVGEAFFEVTKNREKPFIIEALNTEIKVLGTSFNVNTNLPEDKVEVFVESGLVQVTKKNGDEESALVFPGNVAIISKISINNAKNSNDNIIAWRTKQIIFKEESLKNVIITLNKVYNKNITCGDQSILDLRFTSTFKNQQLDSVLSVLCLAFDLKLIEEDNQIKIMQNSM